MSDANAWRQHTPLRRSRFGVWLGRTFLRVCGWRIEGQWPDVPRMVMIVAPHSSAWDAVWGFATILATDVEIVFIGKKELFVGPLGWLLRWFGGQPVDRESPVGVTESVVEGICSHERRWFTLAPEGTRRTVDKWRSGFWRIAKQANVPVFCATFDYPSRRIVLGPLVELGDDMETDVPRIREMFRGIQGKHRGVF